MTLIGKPTDDWVLLGSGESNKGQQFEGLYLQFVCRTHLASLAGKVCRSNNNTESQGQGGEAAREVESTTPWYIDQT